MFPHDQPVAALRLCYVGPNYQNVVKTHSRRIRWPGIERSEEFRAADRAGARFCCTDPSSGPGCSTDPPDSGFTDSALLQRRLTDHSAWCEIDPQHLPLSCRLLSSGTRLYRRILADWKFFSLFSSTLAPPKRLVEHPRWRRRADCLWSEASAAFGLGASPLTYIWRGVCTRTDWSYLHPLGREIVSAGRRDHRPFRVTIATATFAKSRIPPNAPPSHTTSVRNAPSAIAWERHWHRDDLCANDIVQLPAEAIRSSVESDHFWRCLVRCAVALEATHVVDLDCSSEEE